MHGSLTRSLAYCMNDVGQCVVYADVYDIVRSFLRPEVQKTVGNIMSETKNLRILFLKGPQNKWSATCLEYNISAQGDTIETAFKNWSETMRRNIQLAKDLGETPLSNVSGAPPWYCQAFLKAERLQRERKLPKGFKNSSRAQLAIIG